MQRLIALFAAMALSGWSQAGETVVVKDAWVRAPAPGAQVTAAYMTLEVTEPMTLVGASSATAEAVEVHSMSMKNGVMEMRAVKSLDLKPGKPTKLEPAGLHLMLIDLKQPLKAGDQVKIVLNFSDGKRPVAAKGITVPVQAAP
jgi:copper(I)-binding protein